MVELSKKALKAVLKNKDSKQEMVDKNYTMVKKYFAMEKYKSLFK